MKKLSLKPGFEGIFALTIAVIIGLPPLVLGQTKKSAKKNTSITKTFEVSINNGDTIINGKNIKDLNSKERDEYMAFFEKPTHIMLKSLKFTQDAAMAGVPAPGHQLHITIDSLAEGNDEVVRIKRNSAFGMAQPPAPGVFGGLHRDIRFTPGPGIGRNTQTFTYNNVDNDGIATHASFVISNGAKNDDDMATPAKDKPVLELQAVNIAADFATGKTDLSFTLDSKATAEVTLKNNQNKIVFTEKATTGSFSKSFFIANGIYYLTVKQGNNVAEKRIVKED